jgi:hypothetical protein
MRAAAYEALLLNSLTQPLPVWANSFRAYSARKTQATGYLWGICNFDDVAEVYLFTSRVLLATRSPLFARRQRQRLHQRIEIRRRLRINKNVLA